MKGGCAQVLHTCIKNAKNQCAGYPNNSKRAACLKLLIDNCFAMYKSCRTCNSPGSCLEPPSCAGASTNARGPRDPNYLAGLAGAGVQQWIAGSTGLAYVVAFGNDPGAGAAAQQVVVTEPLDPNMDPSQLSLTFVTVTNLSNPAILVSIPPSSFNPAVGIDEFMTNIDLRPVQSLFITLDAKLSTTTNTITWSFNSIDPTTGQPPTSPQIGMLPPGANASVGYADKSRQGLRDRHADF